MGCFKISEKASKLRKEYKDKYGKIPRGWYYEDNETMQEYEKYLQNEIDKNKKVKKVK